MNIIIIINLWISYDFVQENLVEEKCLAKIKRVTCTMSEKKLTPLLHRSIYIFMINL